MSSDYQFISTDTKALVTSLIAGYEAITGTTVQPSSPERMFILWVADVIVQTRVQINFAANQNIPSRASGGNLDALGELFYSQSRPAAKAATCNVRFRISTPQASAVLVPSGTRMTDASSSLFWTTTADAYIPIGDTQIDVPVYCQTVGSVGNGFTAGQINTLVDLFPYSAACENISASDGGADAASDAEYQELLRSSQDTFSTAGPMGGYIYFAKSVSTDIVDVMAIMPKDSETGELMAGHVHIFALMEDGTPASETIKELILEACNDSTVRPLTDFVSAEDPGTVDYNINVTYYIPRKTTQSAAEIQQGVEDTAQKFIRWQSGKLGRDINPSVFIQMLMENGIKRVEVAEPAFTVVNDGTDHTAPEVAKLGTINITNGGYEDE